MNTIRKVLIADDEEHVRLLDLRYIIGQDPRIEIVGVCAAGDEALDGICALQPDIASSTSICQNSTAYSLAAMQGFPPPALSDLCYGVQRIRGGGVQSRSERYLLKPFGEADVREQLDLAVAALSENPAALAEPAAQV